MTKLNAYIFNDREELFQQLELDILEKLREGISARGKASMLLSGGTTPGPLYEKLSKRNFDWDKVWFSLTDERWVDQDHPQSNEKLIRDTLVKNEAKVARLIGLKSAEDDVLVGQDATEIKLYEFPLPSDVVLLGMGEDGHIASLFPGLKDTKTAMDLSNKKLCQAIVREAGEIPRISMTLRAILDTKHIFLLFFGAKKKEVFERARKIKNPILPVSFLLHQDSVPISLYFAD
ncbi:MAG: 6-phosphogluconolactonase [Kordiimonadaceae bacterium]|nr:6-phosphogluconolactonase [Kordiimonadaceae bacterium]